MHIHRKLALFVSILGLVGALALAQDAREKAASQAAGKWVCPPCGHDCLKTTYDKPGGCGVCGMALIPLADAQRQAGQPDSGHADTDREAPRVAVLLFDGVQIIDYTGPWEVFGSAGFEVFSVARTTAPIETVYGMRVTPQYTLAEHPQADIVLVPGGQVIQTQQDPLVQQWLKARAGDADVVLSVCNGAYILAKSGLLSGLRATTTRHLIPGLANAAPDITVVRDVRYVDNGKIVTSGGLSAGLDASLHVAARYIGLEQAQNLARGLEYDWRREPTEAQEASKRGGQ